MNLFKNALDTMSVYANKAQEFASSWSKQDKLRKQLTSCTYSDDSKFVIEKSVKQVYHVYPMFDSDTITFLQSNQQKRYLEIKALMQIEVKGVLCKVDYNIMIPNGFPKKAPYIRIIKPSNDFNVHQYYQKLRSPTDPNSYILNEKLKQIKKWSDTNSLVNVIIESQDLMRMTFPFYKQNNYNPQQQGWNSWQNKGFNPQNNQGFNNQGNKHRPPIPFSTKSTTQLNAQSQKYVGHSKKIFGQMKIQHMKASEKIQSLEQLKHSLQSQQQYLRHENLKMNKFLRQSEDMSTNNLTNLIKPKDEISEQILDLMSSTKAREECIGLLQRKFDDDEITFDQFMKNVRRMEEQKFQEKYLLAKCISVQYGK